MDRDMDKSVEGIDKNSDKKRMLYKIVHRVMMEKFFLKQMDMSSETMEDFLNKWKVKELCGSILESVDERGRFVARMMLPHIKPFLLELEPEPEKGWLRGCYDYVLAQIFPQKREDGRTDIIETQKQSEFYETEGDDSARGRLFLLQLLKGMYIFEKDNVPFDPTMEMCFLTPEEITQKGYNQEYLKLLRLADRKHLYEFMRLGTEVRPYNTLGHIAGVHYVAMYAARQLEALKVPIDLGMVSGAAAGHDIGKYGCRQSEEKRTPYLHYYYTDICFNRFDMPMLGHIAANHSTWDLEMENLSVESLLLIYADFRVKSVRDEYGKEHVHFYTLDQSFQVILDKLDNVDAAKEKRYRRVYNKLKDFEEYMIGLGVDTNLPEVPAREPKAPVPAPKKDIALLRGEHVVREFKNLSIEHNTKLMNQFYSQDDFAGLLEAARSEKQWKNLRTYVSILGEYSTYMTEKQKLMTIRFLSELLVHRESDIRNQAGEIIGQIVAHFNDEYKKELPEGVSPPPKEITNLSLWREVLQIILSPDPRLTEQHKKWIENSLKSIVSALISSCSKERRKDFVDALLIWYEKPDLTDRNKESLLQVAMMVDPDLCQSQQLDVMSEFAERIFGEEDRGLRAAAADVKNHLQKTKDEEGYYKELKLCLGLEQEKDIQPDELSEMYLDNLKAGTPWPIKVANIHLMLRSLEEKAGEGQVLHVATHLGNLVKVSETVVVRKSAGAALVSIIDKLPLEQRNEIAVELGKGLEIGDYQFSKYIPEYLGVIMLHLPPRELDELILDLEKLQNTTNGQVASTVLHTFGVVIENYKIYGQLFGNSETEEVRETRKYKLVNLIIKGFANYNSVISQEALWTIGMNLFGSDQLELSEKCRIFRHCGKKLLTLYENRRETQLDFFNNAAVLKHIYRFISEYELEEGDLGVQEAEKVAFFPGTFDPFSLSHKAIATEIRNMGFEVYLALDEFSWSKKTQPRLQRRRIMSMSVSDEENIYVFPDDIPINIANPADLARLRALFKDRELFFVAGSDVIENASCYRAQPCENSIHSMNHIIFKRSSDERRDGARNKKVYPITAKIINLRLEEYYEDISSTRIRENIDSNRDISNLIDPVAQNFILENSLYMREPAYKHVLQARDIKLEGLNMADSAILADFGDELADQGYDLNVLRDYLEKDNVKMIVIRDGKLDNRAAAVAAVSRLDSIDLLSAFGNQDTAAYIRSRAAGAIAVIGGLFISRKSSITNLGQTILVEIISELLAKDYTYVVYNPCHEAGLKHDTVKIVKKQGFTNIAHTDDKPIYAVDMRSPVIIFKNVDAMIKHPLNKNEAVLAAVEKAHDRLLRVLRAIYPGELILSYNSGIMHHKMINLITRINGVASVPYKEKLYGKFMVVPFGKVLAGVAVPNTVTKTLHTEKYFSRDVSDFTVEESSFYSTLENQVRTIKSFNRPVILVDDLLHKGYRMNAIDPILKANRVEVVDMVAGVQTGRGRDLMTIKEMSVDSAYFLPNLKCWIDESAVYPYIGGDGLKDRDVSVESQGAIPALNMILPYTVPTFLGDIPGSSVYEYSMTCLENARDILKTLEEEYQKEFEQKLTLKRLGEVIADPKNPDLCDNIKLDESMAASIYVEMDIEKLVRMRKMFR